MNAAHTPGPWTALPPTDQANDLFTEEYFFIQGPGSDVHGHMNGADASLIAAAPDLLAALQLLMADERIGGPDGAQARAAIAKATGSRA